MCTYSDAHWLITATDWPSLLFVFAHADDSLNCGRDIAHYAAARLNINPVCATRGECGSATPELLRSAMIAELRTAELLCVVAN